MSASPGCRIQDRYRAYARNYDPQVVAARKREEERVEAERLQWEADNPQAAWWGKFFLALAVGPILLLCGFIAFAMLWAVGFMLTMLITVLPFYLTVLVWPDAAGFWLAVDAIGGVVFVFALGGVGRKD